MRKATLMSSRKSSPRRANIERHALLANLHKIISVLCVRIVVLIHFLFRDGASVVEQSFGECLILTLDPLILLLAHGDVKRARPDGRAFLSERKAARVRLTTKVRDRDVLGHASILFEHLTHALRRH